MQMNTVQVLKVMKLEKEMLVKVVQIKLHVLQDKEN
jgi:hypothetical protein